GFVIAYWIVSVAIGIWAAMRVHTTADFAVAGRMLPFHMVTATVFATWFGSETVLGIPATFIKEGLGGIVADPFGAALCLILFGLILARPLYRMKLLTIGSFYRRRFGRTVEVLTTLAIVASYLGWVGAQIKALGLVFNVVSGDAISQSAGMMIGAASILVYTLFGGMWAVAITDFVQMIVIVLGMLYIGWGVAEQAGGVSAVVGHANEAGLLNLFPEASLIPIIGFIAALSTMMLGSMPQQDVYQRVTSSRTEWIAVWATVLGGVLYLVFAFIPLFLGYSATLIAPDLVARYIDTDSQMILPQLVLQHAPLVAQVLFFGALLSAIKSTASATLLAPSVTFAENIVRPMVSELSDRQMLRLMQFIVLCFTAIVLFYALNTELTIFAMVENAYKVTLVTAFVPLVFGLFWSRATRQGALAAILAGFAAWIIGEAAFADAAVPPQLAGLLASIAGMLCGSLLPQWGSGRSVPERDLPIGT
ncbi:MAG TPA: sodium:solute symporter family protein, partial [Lautropia sp.]|nr:sodium:solute symporter family protein [Lautropia sp.]